MRYQFENYSLDTRRYELACDDRPISLRPLAFHVLTYLVEHRDRVISKDELFERIWPDEYVGDAALSSCLKAIRQAVNDNGRSQRIIRTVRGHGYRFVAPVVLADDGRERPIGEAPETEPPVDSLESVTPTLPHASEATSSLLGREVELDRLSQAMSQAMSGERQVVFVTGEAGIGKTTVMQSFLRQLELSASTWIGQGHCIEQYGTGEAYLPILEALGRFCQTSERAQVAELLNRYAPTWLIQLPALVEPDAFDALSRRVVGSTPERMLREAAEALEALTEIQPLILCLEDLHWSDHATLNLVSYLARRPGRARLVIIGTYRPADAAAHEHPLREMVRELQLHQQCAILPLELLTVDHITTYLGTRFRGQSPSVQSLRHIAELLHQRTEGNPLFMLNMLDYLIEQDQLVQRDGEWQLSESSAELSIPAGLQPFIELRIEQLQREDRKLLEVASVAGVAFSAGAVASVLGADTSVIEAQCEVLVRQERFVQRLSLCHYPDGSISARYGFTHILYQETLYTRLSVTQRIDLHREFGTWEETAYGEQAPMMAVELAMHFERGHLHAKAIEYHQLAGGSAIRQTANQEAVGHLSTALELLGHLPEGMERDQLEVGLQSMIAVPLFMTKGFGATEVEAAFGRARELCQQFPQTPQLFNVLYWLMRFHNTRGELDTSREIAEQMLVIAQQSGDETLMMIAYASLGGNAFYAGNLRTARETLTNALSIYDHPRHKDLFYTNCDPTGMVANGFLAFVMWLYGYPDQADQYFDEAILWAEDIDHPFCFAGVYAHLALYASICGDTSRAEHYSQEVLSLWGDHRFDNFQAIALCASGWVLGETGQVVLGIDRLQEGIAMYRKIGMGGLLASGLLALAQTYLKSGDSQAGLVVVAEALALVEQNNEHWCEAELYRTRGELLLVRDTQRHLTDIKHSDRQEAEDCFQQAIDLASGLGALSWVLRATLSRSRLWQQQGRREDAYLELKTLYDQFTEGFDKPDLQEAKVLLAELAASQSA